MLRRLLIGALALVAFGATSAVNAQVEVTLAEEAVLKIIPDIDKIDTTQGARPLSRNPRLRPGRLGRRHLKDRCPLQRRHRPLPRIVAVRSASTPTDVRTRIMGPNNGNGPEKFIDQIVMYYKTAPGQQQRARVRVVGVTSPDGARAVAAKRRRQARLQRRSSGHPRLAVRRHRPVRLRSHRPRPAPNQARPGSVTAGGDVLFGVQYVGFGIDRDVIQVGSEFGKFDKIRLRVLDNDIFINEMRVVYSNGEPDVLAVAANVPANTRTKWFTLKGDRFIKEIQLVYKSRPGFSGQARVEAYGEYAEGWYGPGPVSAGGAADYSTGEAFKHGRNRGWLYLGGQQPLFFSIKKGLGYETDVDLGCT